MKSTASLVALLVSATLASADSNVFIPATAIRSPFDSGIRAHTNYQIYTGPPLRHQAEPLLEFALHGPNVFEPAQLLGPTGYNPVDIRAAYDLPPGGGAGAIAIIDAFDYQTSLNDFNIFSGEFALPQETSTNMTSSSNHVFQVVYQGSTKPTADPSWAQEEALDIEWAHAMAPFAKIYLVEANSDSVSDLFAAVQKAETLPGVREISMSFGTAEFAQEQQEDSVFVHPGIVFFAAAGDNAGVVDYPAFSPNVVNVGGTSLTLTTSDRLVSESAWDGTGGGISRFEPIPSYQNPIASLLNGFRGGPDVALNADPNTGCSVYDSTPYQGFSGWLVFGGTSLATPCCAGIANVSGRRYTSGASELTHIYSGLGIDFRDIVNGKSGQNVAKKGWDATTGVGVPIRTNSL